MVAVHGISRDAEGMARLLAPMAARTGRTVIAPHFDKPNWPRFQLAYCKNRADLALLRLLGSLKKDGIIPPGIPDLAGFSGGAQFAHRFAWLYPDRVGRLCLSSAGWWTFPETARWPMGMGATRRQPLFQFWLSANLPAFLDRQIVVRVGELDNIPDSNTRRDPELDARQGQDRVTRATLWAGALRDAALTHRIKPDINFAVLPGCGHSVADCVTKGGLDADFLNAAEQNNPERRIA